MFEILIIVVVLLVVFGAGKVKNAGADLGAAVKGFRKSLQAPEPPPAPAPPAAGAPHVEPDAEFPEVVAARARRNGKPSA
jgi:TatA/E family protein of Tat protein translocase